MKGRDPMALTALAGLVVGFVSLVVFDAWFMRLLGVLALFAFIACGVFAIATPALLQEDEKGSRE
jgi:hypothetical protein